MTPVVFVLLCALIQGSRSSPDEDRLLKHLFDPEYQTHNLMTTPIRDYRDHLNVFVEIKEEVEEVLKLQYFLNYDWRDYRLTWNKSDFGNFSYTFVRSSKIWTPLLLLNNT